MRLRRPVHAVVFDMDGLLVDTETLWRDAAIATAGELGYAFPLPLFLSMIGLPNAASRALLVDHFGPDFPLQAWDLQSAEKVRRAAVCLKHGVAELLDHLDACALPRAVATSSSHATVERQLGAVGIAERFDAIVAHGDYTYGKPAPDPFLTAAERLGVDPEHCLALEDSHNGVRAAHAAGMMTVMVPDLLDATTEMQDLCLMVARDLGEVHRLLLQDAIDEEGSR